MGASYARRWRTLELCLVTRYLPIGILARGRAVTRSAAPQVVVKRRLAHLMGGSLFMSLLR